MKRFIKYGVIPVVIFLSLMAATIMVLPVVINVQKYNPEIEAELSNITGRTISIGSNLGLSFFPSLCVSFSDLKIGNPEGFLSDGFLKIESFETRIKLLPLLKKEVQISRFIIGGLQVNLEKNRDGEVNWDFRRKDRAGKTMGAPFSSFAGWSFPEDLFITLFAVTDGTVNLEDRTLNSQHRIDDLMLVLNNVTLNKSVPVDFKASIEGKTWAAEGKIGPLGQHPGQDELPVDLAVNFANTITGQVKGNFINLLGDIGYNLDLHIPSFSARQFFASMNKDFPFATNDSTTFRSVAADLAIKGDKDKISLENGKITVDDTLVENISLMLKASDHLDLGFSFDMDALDLDRYLAADGENQNGRDKVIPREQPANNYYGALNKITLEGKIKIKELQAGGGTVNDFDFYVHGADGIFVADLSSFAFYQGHAESNVIVDFNMDLPTTSIECRIQGAQAQPLLQDFLNKDFLKGTVDADIRLFFAGYSRNTIKTSFYADGTMVFKDGAVKGIETVNGLNNIADSPSDPSVSEQETSTEFSDLTSVFAVRKGIFTTSETVLNSPTARVLISGTADIFDKQLDLRFEPKGAAVITEEQGGEQAASGNSDAFTLAGTFSNPRINVDAKNRPQIPLEQPKVLNVQNLIDGKLPSPDDKDVKNLIGKNLIDPNIVATRFRLQPEVIRKDRVKQQLKAGAGRIQVNPLQEEGSWR